MALVQRCRTLIRQDDLLARYGGEEFVVVLHGASLRQGLKKARALCKEVAGVRYAIDEQHPHEAIAFTVSIGVRGYPETLPPCHSDIKQHSCGNETQGDH